MAILYIYNDKFAALPTGERQLVVLAFVQALGDLLRGAGYADLTPRWDREGAEQQKISTELCSLILRASNEAERIASGPFRGVYVERKAREVARQAVALARQAPHLASLVGTIRVPIAKFFYPCLRDSAVTSHYRFLDAARESVFVLVATLDYREGLRSEFDENSVQYTVEQRIHGATFTYPFEVWSMLTLAERGSDILTEDIARPE